MNMKNFCKATQIIARLRAVRVQQHADYPMAAITKAVGRNRSNQQQQQQQQQQQRSLSVCVAGEEQQNRRQTPPYATLVFTSAFSFNLFGRSDDEKEETPEEKLVTTIKRSILCIQREQYEKAEQMLHLSLRMAQDIQSKDGITYVYDLMANLAMEREQFKKAEKIFSDVMKRLFADGHTEESPKILHISSKIAHMSQLQGELEKAYQGFTWTLQKLSKLLQKMPHDKDLQELYGLTKNWFGQLLMKQGNYAEAKSLFQEALQCLVEVNDGAFNDASVTILNNISVAYVNLENYAEAKQTLLHAMEIAKDLKDAAQEGILQANLGLIFLREGLLTQAQEACKLAWKMGKQQDNHDAIEQAEYCLAEIRATMKG